MKTRYEIRQGAIVKSESADVAVRVYAAPDDAEKQELLETLGIDRHALESALDPDEIPRVEFGPDLVYIIWKRPDNVSREERLRFEVSSVALCLQPNRLTVILARNTPVPFESRAFQKVGTPLDVLLRFLLDSIHHYLGHLRAIKALTAELQAKLNVSMENRYLLQMFALSESLVYYVNALETSASVLTKLRANVEKAGFSREQAEMLDDIAIEHQQCTIQTKIYSSVLSGLMDARGNIINNNMNVLLKNLTLINVVFLPLNLIASIGGMSEYSMMTGGLDWRISYSLFAVAMLALGYLTWILLVRKIGQTNSSPRGKNGTGTLSTC